MLSQNDLERERYLARAKLQRDELSRMHGAYRGGHLAGMIHTYQKLLRLPQTPDEELLVRPLEELQELAERLEKELMKGRGEASVDARSGVP